MDLSVQSLKLGFVEKGSQTKSHETNLVCPQTKNPDEHPRALTRARLDLDLGEKVSQAKLRKKEGRALAGAAAAVAGIWGIVVRGHRHI